MEKWCSACGQPFAPRPQTPRQTYCGEPDCQRARRNLWQRTRRQSDPDYIDNQAQAHRAWAQRNAGYWRTYRAAHPEYVERNRQQQAARRANGRHVAKEASLPGAPPLANQPAGGLYHLTFLSPIDVANNNACLVRLSPASMVPS